MCEYMGEDTLYIGKSDFESKMRGVEKGEERSDLGFDSRSMLPPLGLVSRN